MKVNYSARSGGLIWISFRFSFNMKVWCVFSLESPRRDDFNEYTQYTCTIFNIKKKIILNYPKSAAMCFCSKGLKNEFETAVVNEPSVFEPLKFYCILHNDLKAIYRVATGCKCTRSPNLETKLPTRIK